MTITPRWRPWVAGAAVLLIALTAGWAGWWLSEGSQDAAAASQAAPPTAGPLEVVEDVPDEPEERADREPDTATAQDAPTTAAEHGAPSEAGPSTETAESSGDPTDVSDLAGEGEDYGPEASDSTDEDGGYVFYMPELDPRYLAGLFGDEEVDCPPELTAPDGTCIDYGEELSRFGNVPMPPGH
ncbi:MAG TPA: hypothetical protein VNZ66_00710 [Aeromicrobium sp.]|nr:hypothetical protein [Aeromicrobium sp.]